MNYVSHSFNLNEISGQFCYNREQNATLWPSANLFTSTQFLFVNHFVLLMAYAGCCYAECRGAI
jgi:hypothetical protein